MYLKKKRGGEGRGNERKERREGGRRERGREEGKKMHLYKLNTPFYLITLSSSSQVAAKDTYFIYIYVRHLLALCPTPWVIVFALKDLMHKMLTAKLVISNTRHRKMIQRRINV